MREILGKAKTVRELLKGVKYTIDYYQREYKWQDKNLLARSLHPQCYDHNPGFLRFKSQSGLPFRPHAQFKKVDLDERGALYREIAERIWDPDQLLREVGR